MEKTYMRTSSLARKFFEDFPDADLMPLMLSGNQKQAYQRLVRPLLDLQASTPDMSALCTAATDLISKFRGDISQYGLARSAAEYVQCPFALCITDAAAARVVHAGSAAFSAALAATDPVAFKEILAEDIKRRFVANSITDPALPSISISLDKHPAVAAGKPTFNGLDSLLLPDNSAYTFTCSQQQPGSEADTNMALLAAAFKPINLAVENHPAANGSSPASKSAALADAGAAPSILKRAVWRRQITRSCSHYLGSVLGKDGPGTVVLTGMPLAGMVKGVDQAAAAASADSPCSSSTSSSTTSGSVSELAFVGYTTAADAQAAMDGCLTEITLRYFKRHLVPVTDSHGRAVQPLAVATAHHLLLLLPEPTQTVLPTAVLLDAAALAAAADHGAWEGPAAAAAAVQAPAAAAAGGAGLPELPPEAVPPGAAAPQAPPPPAAAAAAATTGGFKDVVLSFDLALHRSMDALLLSAAAVNPLAAFAYDGEEMYTLLSAVRALASGGVLVDPAASAGGKSVLTNPAPAGAEECSVQSAKEQITAIGGASPTELMTNPERLRTLLDGTHPWQQQQQGAGGHSNRQQLQQQMAEVHGWVWGVLQDQPAAGGGSNRGVPAAVAAAVEQRWWSGPIMKGSVLEGSVLDQQ